jgi:drug/metabolite transporter (DMT)-like permease
MSWQLLTLVSVTTFSISVLLQRLLLHKNKSDPLAYVVVFQGSVGLLVGLYALLLGFQMPDLSKLWLPMLATVVLYGAGHVAYAKTLQQVEASAFPILFATQAVWVMLIGLTFFQERLTIAQVAGTVLIFSSVGMLTKRPKGIKTHKLEEGIVLGLLTGLLFGIASALWAYVGRRADTASWTSLSFLGPALVVFLWRPRTAKKLSFFLEKEVLSKIALLGVIFSVSAVTLMQAYKSGNVSLVAPLRQTGIILTLLLAMVFLHERTDISRKVIASLICFAGVVLII